MMSRSTLQSRLAATLTLLFQLLLVGVGPVVDARVELGSHGTRHAELHVESADDPACDPGRAHEVCLIVALRSMVPSPEAPAAVVGVDYAPSVRPLTFGVRPPSVAAISSLGARAPPVV